MTIKELKDYLFDSGIYRLEDSKAGIDASFTLELDEHNWEEFQEDMRNQSNIIYINGEQVSDADLKEFTFNNLRIPFLGEFEIIKSDKFSLIKKEE